jgi:hypothetical protein
MSTPTGAAGLLVTALVSAVVAAGVSTLLSTSASAPAPSPAAGAGGTENPAAGTLEREVERLRTEVREIRAESRATSSPSGGPATPSSSTPPTRDEIRALVDERVAERLKDAPAVAAAASEPAKQRTLDEAGAELGLSSVDIDSVKRAWRASELEAVMLIMGTSDLDAIKEEVKAAEADPDRKKDLIKKVVGNGLRNFAEILTVEDRRNRELRKYLNEDQMKKLKGMDIRSTLADEGLEDVVERAFGGK